MSVRSHIFQVHLFAYGLGIVAVCLMLASSARANNVAVVVGCNGNGLQFADADARLMAKTLVQFAGYRKEDVCILTSKPQDNEREATAENISKAIGEMANRQADSTTSTFLFFASTHGVETKEHVPMIAAKDYDQNQPPTGAQAELTAQKLTQRLAGLKSGLVVAMFDICRKDGILRSDDERRKEFVLPKGAAGKVATIFSSSEGPSFECADDKQAANGHGYFTFYICQGLSARKSEKDVLPIVGGLDERVSGVTVKSLHEYVRWNLLEQTKDLVGAGGAREERGQNGEDGKAVALAVTGLGGQLPELKCEAIAEQGLLARYAKGTCRAERSPDDKYADLRDDALDLYEAKEYERAGFQFERAFRVRREAWAAHVAGLCYDEAGKPKQAEEQYRNALTADPKYAKAMNNLAVLFNNQGKIKESEEQYRNAIVANPKYVLAMTNLGLLLYNQGKMKEAEEYFRNAISLDAKYVVAMFNMGNLLRDQGKVKEAEEQYRNALAVNPKYVVAMHNLGLLLANQGKVKEAEEQYRNAIAADANYAGAMFNLGLLLGNQGKMKEAEEQFRRAIRLKLDDGLYHASLSLLLFLTNRRGEALTEAKQAQQLGVKQHPVFEKLGLKTP